ncbi:MAG: EF-hand domain-containing protein [Deltaproteobacteria bacterium]|nr:EF-hand domain-containing protein [Deltaproteobacteria bacterium]
MSINSIGSNSTSWLSAMSRSSSLSSRETSENSEVRFRQQDKGVSENLQSKIESAITDVLGGLDKSSSADQVALAIQDAVNSVMEESGIDASSMKGSPKPPPGPPPSEMSEDEIGAIFDEADTDKDGKISAQELAASLSDSNINVEDLLKSLDSDSDGQVSKTEFVEGAKKPQQNPEIPPPQKESKSPTEFENMLSGILENAGFDAESVIAKLATTDSSSSVGSMATLSNSYSYTKVDTWV